MSTSSLRHLCRRSIYRRSVTFDLTYWSGGAVVHVTDCRQEMTMKPTRSDGSIWMGIGQFCGLGCALTALFATLAETYSGLWWLCIGVATGLFNLTILALVTGSIIRAIWFLPADAEKIES